MLLLSSDQYYFSYIVGWGNSNAKRKPQTNILHTARAHLLDIPFPDRYSILEPISKELLAGGQSLKDENNKSL